MLEITSAKLTGTPGSSGWAQVHEFKSDDPEKQKARGQLFAVIATKRQEEGEIDTISAGRELIGRLHEEYFGDLSAKPFNALGSATQKVCDEFKTSWGDVEIAAAAFVDGVVYSAAAGGAQVYISRDGALGKILESKTEGSVISASGYPKDKDTILLGTNNFFQKVSQGVLKAALVAGTPMGVVDSFGPAVHLGEGNGALAAAVIRFSEKSTGFGVIEKPPIPEKPAMEVGPSPLLVFGKKASLFIEKIVKKMPERRIYVKPGITDEVSNQNKKLTFSIAIVLIFLLIISIIFGIRQKGINDVRGKYEAILSTAQKDVDEAISLASVSPERSRELFLSSEEKLREIDALNIKDPKVEDLRKKINDGRGAILGEFPVSPEMFLDLSLLSSGFKGDTLTLSGGNIFILDKSGRRVISVELSTKKSKVVVGPDTFDEAFDMASYEDRVFILSGDGIYEVGTGKNKVIDKTWDGDALIKAFAGNIYVLDKSGNTIYRYQGSGSGFGDRGTWLAATTQANFSDVGQWVIDGAVYTLSTDSKVLKFSLGSPQRFSLSGVIPEIGKIDAIFAGDDTQNVYVIDRAGKRIVVLDKSGNYKAQYISDSISEASNIVVSESSKKILMLVGDKLYGIDIKN